jgi:hypothetical protein
VKRATLLYVVMALGVAYVLFAHHKVPAMPRGGWGQGTANAAG